MSGEEFTDRQAEQLAFDLYRYVTIYDWTEDSISSLIGDIAMAQDVTSDELDRIRQEIEMRFPKEGEVGHPTC